MNLSYKCKGINNNSKHKNKIWFDHNCYEKKKQVNILFKVAKNKNYVNHINKFI